MRILLSAFALVGFFVYAQNIFAAMSSTNYEIRWDTISTGGSDTATSTSYGIRDVVTSVAGTGSSTSYQIHEGYRGGIFDQIITFLIFAQNATSGRAATALSGNTITVSTSGISADDFIVLIQDEGTNQVAAIGRVSSIGSGTITVDRLTYASSAPAIDGSNDFLYLLNSTSLDLGSLSTSQVKTILIGFQITADVDAGYVVQMFDDGNLRSGTVEIDDVSDGTVTTGSSEYGARSSDTSLSNSSFDTADTAITTTPQDIVTRSTFGFSDRNFVTLKTAIGGSKSTGRYSQILTFIASGNF